MDMELDAIRQRDAEDPRWRKGWLGNLPSKDRHALLEHIAELERERDEAQQRGYRQGLEQAGAYMAPDAAECARLRAAAQAVVEDHFANRFERPVNQYLIDALARELEGSAEKQ